jgi:hypothetical protein
MKWLLNHRTDFTDNGWGQLCGTENMKYGVMGGHHFSMMKVRVEFFAYTPILSKTLAYAFIFLF